jgi:uncharacterized protein with HEPN domain
MITIADRLNHALVAIDHVFQFSSEGHAVYDQSILMQSAINRQIQIVGEALRTIPVDFRQDHSEIAWAIIVGIRNVLVHRYYEVKKDIIWVIIERDLPVLKKQLEKILQDLNQSGGTDESITGN